MAHIDIQYNKLVRTILNEGFIYQDKSRANINMLQIPHYTLDIDMLQGFPLLTTKRIYWKSFIHELIWMISGSQYIDYLQENKVTIWDADAAKFDSRNNYVGRIYGAQWRQFRTYQNYDDSTHVDQLSSLLHGLRDDFYNRKHIVTAWNPAELKNMALPPCHWSFEIIPCSNPISGIGFMLKWHQRSVDTMLGLPFDIGLYATLGKLIEKEINRPFVRLIGDLSNVHFYEPHIKLVRQQIMRDSFAERTDIIINPTANFFNLNIKDFGMTEYNPHPPIKAELFTKK